MDLSGYIATLIGTAAGLIALYQSSNGWRRKVVVGICIIVVGVSAFQVSKVTEKLRQLESTYRQANTLIDSRRMDHTNQGFIFAALAFLEAKNDQFPDTYQRALEVCEAYRCTEPDSNITESYNSIEAAGIFESMLEGIAAMSQP